MVDGLALGVMPEAAAKHGGRLALVGLVHHHLCLETGLELYVAERLRASERAALAWCRRVIVTSPLTARTVVAEFDVPTERVSVALPRIDPALAASASATGLLVPPLDREALTVAPHQVLGNPDMRRQLHEGALAAREGLPRRADTATAIEQVLLVCEVS
ncbi:MAG: hypothetical protein ACJ8AW_05185 [Rhodopila sp.]